MIHPLAEYLRRPDPKNPAKRLTQEQFAEAVKTSQSTVSKFLSGELQKLPQDLAERVVAATGGRVTLLDCLYSTPHHLKGQAKRARAKRRPSPNTS